MLESWGPSSTPGGTSWESCAEVSAIRLDPGGLFSSRGSGAGGQQNQQQREA